MIWVIESSQKVKAPKTIRAQTLPFLRTQLQELADGYRPGPDAPALGDLHYRYELDENDRPLVVHSYFYNKDRKLSRFIRLRRK